MPKTCVYLLAKDIERIEEIQNEYKEEEITLKGYVKAVKKMVYPHLESSEVKEFTLLEDDLKSEDITEKGFYNKSKKLLDSLTFAVKESEINLLSITPKLAAFAFVKDKENNKNVENGACLKVKREVNHDLRDISSTSSQPETKVRSPANKDAENKESKENGDEMSSQSETKSLTPVIKCEKNSMNEATTSRQDTRKPRSTKKVCINGQPLITNSFLGFSKKVTPGASSWVAHEEEDGEEQEVDDSQSKRIKKEDDNECEGNELLIPMKRSQPSCIKRCEVCKQLLSSEELKLYPGHPEGAQDEFIALTDPKLSLFTGEEENAVHEYDQRPQHKITCFNVYDKEGHLCPFDGGLIEKNVLLYFSGFLKPIYDENPSIEDGIPAKEIGPINEWWISGFDGGEKALIGFSTPFAEYILMEASEVYRAFFDSVQEKIYLSKLVIEVLVHSIEPSYEDLLLKIQTAVPPAGIASFTEDSLLRHAQFICEQVHNFDLAGDDWEEKMIFAPCIRCLIKLAGVTLGKKRSSRIRVTKKVDKMPKMTKATTTPLVRDLFESFFSNQLAQQEDAKAQPNRRTRCGVCEVCQEPDCGKCRHCRDMVKFGGSGRSKQCCVNRRCPNMAVLEREESDGEEDVEETDMDHQSTVRCHGIKKRSRNVEWVGSSIAVEDRKTYYTKVKINEEEIGLGDCVMVEPDDPKVAVYIARVQALWEVKGRWEKFFHADWFCRGSDSILGETADEQELFLINDCEDTLLEAVLRKVTVIEYSPPDNWSSLGGCDVIDPLGERNDEHTFFFQKWYNPELARFEDLPALIQNTEGKEHKTCQSCLRIREEEASEMCVLGERLERVETTLNQYNYRSLKYLKTEFEVGDCAYIDPASITFKVKQSTSTSSENKKKVVDETTYPEFYRKTSDKVKGSNVDTPEPFKIVRILKVICKDSELPLVSPDDVKLRIAKFYRPENTHKGITSSYQADLNLLYWSEEEATIPLSTVRGKCHVVFGENLQCHTDDYFLRGPNRFKFVKSYDADKLEFYDPPENAQQLGAVGKGKGQGKGKGKAKQGRKEFTLETNPEINTKLRTLDVFAGCGGLSAGMHEAGLSETNWAVEIYEPAAQAFRLNNPDTIVFTDDCNLLLKLVMEGETQNDKGQSLPQKGDVDMLCGGPPCQGFSGMNRFNSRQYSQFKNSLVASFLSYCDYYRPKYFLLENVRNFVSYKCSMVLKLTLRVLIKMGYQCTVGVLQAGNYGVPQTRRRAIILAAAPGETLPWYPEPLTTFSPRASQLTVAVDNKKYSSNCHWVTSAPLRTVTVRDALFDLPHINNGAKKDQINYGSEPESHFQRLIRGNQYQPVLKDHICKDMAPLIEARMKHIPTAPGSDWRDLPNISMRLADGNFSKVLVYSHHDKRNGRSSTGALRGVCSCASGRPCDPMDKQFNTLIPWCLPHTGNRHNHWSGLYGRLEWDGFFSTTVTNPEPMGKQGRVLHPEQNRVVSVRECARSQGFPDTYRFHGSLLEKHRQIGNAVPPPMAKAIGTEIMKAILRKRKSDIQE